MKKDKCQEIRSLLINKEISEIESSDAKLIETHLNKCIKCRKFETSIGIIRTTEKEPLEVHVKPRAEILSVLKDHMQKEKVHSAVKKNTFGPLMKTRFYPAAAAVFIALMIVFSIKPADHTAQNAEIDSSYYKLMILTQPAVININKMDQQIGGNSMREDSLLLQYITSAM